MRVPAALAVLAVALPLAVTAQEEGGAALRFDVAPGLSYSADSAGEDRLAARTDLSLAFSSQTRAAVFDLSLGTGFEVDSDGGGLDIADPALRLGYARESRDAAFGIDLRTRRIDLGEALRLDPAGLEPGEVLRLDQGTRTDSGATATLSFGRTARTGGALSYGIDRTEYRDTVDPDLRDSTTQALNGQLEFRIDDRITARLDAGLTDRDVAAGGTDRTTQSLGLGVDLAVTPVLDVAVAAGYERQEQRGPDGTETAEGFTGGVTLGRALPNGRIDLSLETSIDNEGRRSALRFARAMALDDLTTLSFELGASYQDTFGVDPVLGFNYAREFKRGALNAGLTQTYATTDEGESVRDTAASLSWAQALSRNAGLTAGLSLRDRAALTDGADDLTRFDVNLAYNHALSADWDAVASYVRSTTREDGAEDRTTDSLFVGVRRSFDWRF